MAWPTLQTTPNPRSPRAPRIIGGRFEVPLFRHVVGVAALLVLTTAAHAGRPLATDDAGTAAEGTCQVEVWRERSQQLRAMNLSPACGFRRVPSWVPITCGPLQMTNRFGRLGSSGNGFRRPGQMRLANAEVQVGLKFASGWAKDQQKGWKHATIDALMLATSPVNDVVTAHINIGYRRDKS